MAKAHEIDADADEAGPEVDFENLAAARPAESLSQPAQGWLGRLTEGWASSAALGFRQGRSKTRKQIQKPDYNFIEMFFKNIETERGPRKLGFGERMKRAWDLGRYTGDTAVNKAADRLKNLRVGSKYDPDQVSILDDGSNPFDAEKGQKEFENEFARSQGRTRDEGDDFWRREDDPRHGAAPSMDRVRIVIDPMDTSRQVESNRVGPERQIPLSTDPWPLGRPSEKEAPERRALPAPRPKQIEDHRDEAEKKAADRRSKSEAASDRGRAAAQRMAREKAKEVKPKALKRDQGDLEL